MGPHLDAYPVMQRSKRKATRWRFAGCKIWQRFFYLHELLLVPAIARRRFGSISIVREHVVTGKMNAGGYKADARSWRKAYGLALSLFAVEVVLLYLFTIRFS